MLLFATNTIDTLTDVLAARFLGRFFLGESALESHALESTRNRLGHVHHFTAVLVADAAISFLFSPDGTYRVSFSAPLAHSPLQADRHRAWMMSSAGSSHQPSLAQRGVGNVDLVRVSFRQIKAAALLATSNT